MASIVAALLAVAAAFVLAPMDKIKGGVQYLPSFRVHGDTPHTGPMQTEHFKRDNVYFKSQGETLEAWLYTPLPAAAPTSCVVMAHGLGGQRDFGLALTASRLAAEGFSVLVFDYRSFGGSDGEPRHWVSPSRHVEDYYAAVRAVQEGLDGRVSCARVSLWGTSLSGGHVLVAAAKLGANISAVVSQIPHLDGTAASRASLARRGLRKSLLILLAALHDRARAALGLSPAYIKLVGNTDELAFMQLSTKEQEQYRAKHPEIKVGGWQPVALARFALEIPRYNPRAFVPNVTAPVLFIACERDSLCPAQHVMAAANEHAKVQSASELLTMECSHFELYLGQVFEKAIKEQVRFLKAHAGASGQEQNAGQAGAPAQACAAEQ